MKTLISIIVFISCYGSVTYTQTDENPPTQLELRVENMTSGIRLYVRAYPVSMVFNGYRTEWGYGYNYNTLAIMPQQHPILHFPGYWWDYINGVGIEYYQETNGGHNWVDAVRTSYLMDPGQRVDFNLDPGESNTQACFGYGIYRVEISNNPNFLGCDSILFEQDYEQLNCGGDARLEYRPDGHIHFLLASCNIDRVIDYGSLDGYFMRPWKLCGCSKGYREFYYDSHCDENIIPLDCRRDCDLTYPSHPKQNHDFPAEWTNGELKNDVRQGDLTNWLIIAKSVETPQRDEIYTLAYGGDFTNQITIREGAIMTLNAGINFTMVEYPSQTENVKFTVKGKPNPYESGGVLRLLQNTTSGGSTFIVKRNSFLYLERTSTLNFSGNTGNSKVIVERGGLICFGGAHIFGYGTIEIHGPITALCDEDNIDQAFEDSTNVILVDSASWTIPDNSTITLDGNVTSLKMAPNTEIKFGANSKLILQNGAHLVADHAKFTFLRFRRVSSKKDSAYRNQCVRVP